MSELKQHVEALGAEIDRLKARSSQSGEPSFVQRPTDGAPPADRGDPDLARREEIGLRQRVEALGAAVDRFKARSSQPDAPPPMQLSAHGGPPAGHGASGFARQEIGD